MLQYLKYLPFLIVILFINANLINCDEDIRKNRVLVLIDNLYLNSTHSVFLQDLRDNGFKVDIKTVNAHGNKIKEFGEFLYDHIILFCTSEQDPRGVRPNSILDFFDGGNNILIAGDIDATKPYRQLFNNFGVDIDEIGSQLVDHFSNAGDSEHAIIKTSNIVKQQVFTGPLNGELLYRGAGLTLTNYENYQVHGIVQGSEYTYSKNYAQDSKNTLNVGHAITLVATVQGRNNARAVLTGSLDMFSNELYEKSNGVNRQFTQNILKWNFNERGVLRVGNIFHHKIGENYQPTEYKIMDDISYSIEIDEWNPSNKKWEPYIASDLQMEFIMLDPYVRMSLVKDPTQKNSKFYADFKLPDKYGVFKFVVNYKKPGFSFISTSTKVPVRPFKHNEYDRYLFQAYPYYIGVFGTMFAFFIFFIYFLFDKSQEEKVKQE